MIKYTRLRDALFAYCDADHHYDPLWASFILASNRSNDIANQSVVSFPTYTRHDSQHSAAVLAKMEMLIGEKRISLLGPTDLWLLMMCAHTHDLGMVVTLDNLRDHFENENGGLQKHYEELKREKNGDYQKAAYELDFDDAKKLVNAKGSAREIIRNLEAHRNLMLVLQSYFRKFHSGGYGRLLGKTERNDIDIRLHDLVDKINKTHTGSISEVASLPRKTDGFLPDHAHPRFAAMMLRVADTMDIDSSRVNPYSVSLTLLDDESLSHHEKHLAVESVITTPKRVGAVFNFSLKNIEKHYTEQGEGANFGVLRADKRDKENKAAEIRAFAAKLAFDWYYGLKSEIEYLALNWNSIVPRNYTGSAPQAKENDFKIMFDNEVVSFGDLDLRYVLNYKRSYEILRGAGLYGDEFTFIREFVQNAMDAAKIQLFDDWRKKNDDENYKKDYKNISVETFFKQLPYPIDEMKIKVWVEVVKENDGKEHYYLLVKDNGIGISREKLSKMKYVGNIYDPEVEKIKELMPDWLKPTGAFGIGLQSVFSFAKRFYMETRSVSSTNNALYIICKSTENGGEIFCEKREEPKRNGTTIKVSLDKMQIKSPEDLYIKNEYGAGELGNDVFAPDRDIISPFIRQYLKTVISPDILPVVFEVKRANSETEGEPETIADCVFRKAFGNVFIKGSSKNL